MSNAADRIRASATKARTVAAPKKPATPQQPEPKGPSEPATADNATPKHHDATPVSRPAQVIAPLQRSIRKNVDLSPDQNDRLADWQRSAARELGVARVTAQEVLVALVEKMLSDPNLGQQIKQEIHARR